MWRLCLVLGLLAQFCVRPALGATITASSTSLSSVQAAVNAANDGDTVLIPAGSSTWTGALTIDKSISVIGAGIGQTILTDAAASETKMIWMIDGGRKSMRVSGMTIQQDQNNHAQNATTTDN